MADYKYVKKLVILDKGEFWMATVLLTTGLLCVGAFIVAMALHASLTQICYLAIIGTFNTMNGILSFDTKQLYTWKKKRVPKTEAEKLGD
jgi:hypothetical protein